MQTVSPEQAVRMRNLAAELREAAACTAIPDYRVKLERTARELEDQAIALERNLDS